MQLPPEDILRYIEDRRGLIINREHFMSTEGCKINGTPVFYANNGKGDGSNTGIASYNGINYVVKSSIVPSSKPIPLFKSGRNQ